MKRLGAMGADFVLFRHGVAVAVGRRGANSEK